MVKRRRAKKTRTVRMGGKSYACKPTKASRAKYKKCILTAIRGTKITTRKGAQKAFARAAKKCRGLLTGKMPARRHKKSKKRKFRGLRVPHRGRSRTSGLLQYGGGRPLWGVF